MLAMRDGWRLEILGEISEVIMGRQLSPSKKMGTRPRPYIRAANIGSWGISLNEIFEMDFTEDEEARFASRIGDTLLVEGGNEKSVGCPGLVTENEAGLCIQNTVIRCRVKNPEVFHPEFQYQVLRYMYWRRDFAELCAGTTIMHLGQKRAELVPILLPPLPEQKRIVDLISSVDSYIETLQQQLESAKKSRNAVLHELLTAGGDDWIETTLGEVTHINPEQAKDFDSERLIKYVDLSTVTFDNGIDSEIDPIPFNEAPGRARRIVRENDVIVATVRPYLKGFAFVNKDFNEQIASTGFCVIRADSQLILPELVWALVGSDDFVDFLIGRSTGSSYPAVRPIDISEFNFMLPPFKDQETVSQLIRTFDQLIKDSTNLINTTQNLRSGLLSNLLSGKHEIPSSYDKVIGAA
jgi:restriction endonuclease S subunit